MATTTRVLNANVTGTVYNTNLNSTLEALDTSHSGPTAPTDEVVNGKLWLDTSTTPSVLKVYDNGGWNEIYTDRGNLSIDGNDVTSTAAELNVLDGISGIASQAEAEAGVVTDKLMTPLRVLQSIDANSLSPFTYNAVSGATQALDVGTYNFFEGGTLTADTTVSFSSVPTEARWTYTYRAGATASYSINTLSELGFYGIAGDTGDSFPKGVGFKTDGTKMYVVGVGTDSIYQFSLSTAWDVSTASYDSVSLSVSAQDGSGWGLFFKSDGLTFFMLGNNNTRMYQYSMSTAWDLSTASYASKSYLLTSGVGANNNRAGFVRADGLRMYVADRTSKIMYQHNLSTAWDVSTAAAPAASYDLDTSVAFGSEVQGLAFTPDGLRLFALDSDGYIMEYSLSTAWDLGTISFVQKSSYLGRSQASDLEFAEGGDSIFYVTDSGNGVVKLSSVELPTLTLPASVQNPPTETVVHNNQPSYTFFTADGGTTVKLINEEVL
jgi:hypothetical protein